MVDKKKQSEPVMLFGRPGNTLQMGIVGLPNVGKSSTFNLLSKQSVPAKNQMFCTIDPNKAKVIVPDPRFEFLCNVYKPKSKVPASLNILDIAGLVRGASTGQGMGNAFLSHIQAVDGIYHAVRVFEDEDVQHFEGEVDPIRDLETIKTELIEKDKIACKKLLDAAEEKAKRAHNDKAIIFERDTIKKAMDLLNNNQNIRDKPDWNGKEIEILNNHYYFTAKPGVYLCNLSEDDYILKKNKYLKKIVEWVNNNGGGKIIPYSVAFEEKLVEMSAEDREAYCKEKNAESALGKIITAGYHCLDLLHFFTAGEDEVKCWTIRRGTTAPNAAGVIHTDFKKNFISAEVMKFEDLKELGTENKVKAEGKVRTEGKLYEVLDGDICHFKIGK